MRLYNRSACWVDHGRPIFFDRMVPNKFAVFVPVKIDFKLKAELRQYTLQPEVVVGKYLFRERIIN
jgi:hypothetical protein